jgi:hypothetical protein
MAELSAVTDTQRTQTQRGSALDVPNVVASTPEKLERKSPGVTENVVESVKISVIPVCCQYWQRTASVDSQVPCRRSMARRCRYRCRRSLLPWQGETHPPHDSLRASRRES